MLDKDPAPSMQAAPDALSTLAAERAVLVFDESGTVVSFNQSAPRSLGLPAERLIGVQCRAAVDAASAGQPAGSAGSLGVQPSMLTLVDGQGDPIVIRGTALPLGASVIGHPVTLFLLDQDRPDAGALAPLSSESLADISHEVRTPLCAIAGYLDILSEQHRSVSRRDLGQIVRVLRRNTRWLERLADNLLTALNMYAGRFALDPRPTALTPLVLEAVSLCEVLAAGKEQQVAVVLPDRAAAVLADRRYVLQVLVNLLSRAIGHASREGRITISATQSGRFWQISVTDDTPGLAWWEEHQPTRAGAALQASANPAPPTELGISLARAVVNALGGMMGLVSSREKGSKIWFTLPAAGEVNTATPESVEAELAS